MSTVLGVYVGITGRSMVAVMSLDTGKLVFRRTSVALPSVISLTQMEDAELVVLYVDHPMPTARSKIILDIANRTSFWEQACASQDLMVFRVGGVVLEEAFSPRFRERLNEHVGRKLKNEENLAGTSAVYGCRLVSDKKPPVVNVIANLTSTAV